MSVKVTTEVAEVEASKAPPDAQGQARTCCVFGFGFAICSLRGETYYKYRQPKVETTQQLTTNDHTKHERQQYTGVPVAIMPFHSVSRNVATDSTPARCSFVDLSVSYL